MSLKDLLVHIDGTQANRARLDAAVQLAQRFDAHLVGVYVIPQYHLPPYAEVQIGSEIMAVHREAAQARGQTQEAVFRRVCEDAGIAFEWRCVEGDLIHTLRLHGRYVDLVVVGQSNDDDPDSQTAGVMDHLVLEIGRPVLFVPYIGASKTIGDHVMVAWNGSREAVRAVSDAMPLLDRAGRVEVVSINPSELDGEGDLPGADLALHLARHNVKAEAHQIRTSGIDVGNLLLSRAADEEVDLIVMGAYGHSRFREMVFGGATRHLLEHMTVPVLMSH